MKITPLDIRRKEFRRGMRGYADDEVDLFLDDVADEFERLYKENVELQERVQRLEEQSAGHAQLKDALEKTLVSAQLQADQVIANANKESELILRDAGTKAREIVNEAYGETQKVQQTLVQLKHLEEDFRFKFRSLLEGHLNLLNEEPFAVPAHTPVIAVEAANAGGTPEEPGDPDATLVSPAADGETVFEPIPESDPVPEFAPVAKPSAVAEPSEESAPEQALHPAPGAVSEPASAPEPAPVAEAVAEPNVATEASPTEVPASEAPVTDASVAKSALAWAAPGSESLFPEVSQEPVREEAPTEETEAENVSFLPGATNEAAPAPVAAEPERPTPRLSVESILSEPAAELSVTRLADPTEDTAETTQGFYFGRRLDDDDDTFFTAETQTKDQNRDFEW